MKCAVCSKEMSSKRRKICPACRVAIRRHRQMQAAIELLGGKCCRCGYNECVEALEFHHKDPSQKDFAVGRYINLSWVRVKQEVLKCELVCSNCHKKIHQVERDEVFLQAVENYKGKELI